MRYSWGLLVFASLVVASCVGDSTAVSDGGADTTAPTDQFVADTSDVDANTDAASPMCDVNKPFGAPTLISSLDNSGFVDGTSLRLSPDLLTGYFTQQVIEADGGYDLTHIYTATRTSPLGAFSTAVNLASLNSALGETHPSVTGDGLTIFFDESTNGIEIATRTTTAAAFGTAAPLQNVNTGSEAYPFVRQDAQALYFERSSDLYRSTWTGSAFDVGTAVTELNTSASETYSTVTPDDLVIYFSSERTDGGALGGFDIWVATRASSTEQFGSPHNVTEVNTAPNDEKATFITSDRCSLYFWRQAPNPSDGGVGVQQQFVATKTP
jgi:hypothetical protein